MLRRSFGSLAIVTALVSCTGSEGPQGPAGLDGTDGTNGTDGLDGTALYRRTVVVSPDPWGGSLANGAALLAAMDGLDGGTSYLLKIEPGVYDLGDATLTVKPGISVEGAGEYTTRIVSSSSSGPTVFIGGGTSAGLRDLAIRHEGGVDNAVALEADTQADLTLYRVGLQSTNGALTTVGLRVRGLINAMDQVVIGSTAETGAVTGFECIGCWVNGGYGRLSTVVVRARAIDSTATPDRITGIGVSTGVDSQGAPRDGSLSTLVNFDVVASGDSLGSTVAIDLRGGVLRADSLRAFVGGTDTAVVRVADASALLRNSELKGYGSAASSAGIRTVDADVDTGTSVDVVGSSITFNGSSIDGTADARVRLAHSQLAYGSITGSAAVTCFAVYDAYYASSGLDACP